MIFVVDNYDSFTYNLVQYLGELGEDVVVKRNDETSPEEIKELEAEAIVISPGPGRPENAGVSVAVIQKFSGTIPILGVCLGHQCIAEVYGAEVVRGERIMHGKVSDIFHNGDEIFKGIDSPFTATRYHSLIVKRETIKDPLVVIAETNQGEIMALRHKENPLWGVQFHPESILTSEGRRLVKNFLGHKIKRGE